MIDAPRMPIETGKAEPTGECMPTEKNAQTQRKSPFTSMDGRRNITAIYRAVFDFHKRHSPPVIDDPANNYDYWAEVGKDMWKTSRECDSDPFVTDLLIAVMKDLEREYKKAKQERNTNEKDTHP